jgi:flagellar hook-associated protein 1 FlgK
MLGLFGALNLGARSLQNQQLGVEVAGHNLANVNNPAYSRQRVQLTTSLPLPGACGPQGAGADVAGIEQLRDYLLDGRLQSELSVTGYYQAQQQALENAQAELGQTLDRTAATQDTDAASTGGASGLAAALNNLFGSFQSLTANPASLTERQGVLQDAQLLASQFNQTDQRLAGLHQNLNESLESDVASVNQLLANIAKLNGQIADLEAGSGGTANDLRDQRQAKIEELAKLVNVDVAGASNGTVDVSIAGVALVSGNQVLDTLETYEAGNGQRLVRTQAGAAPLTLTGGRLQGTIEARDGALAALRAQLNTLAGELLTQVNTIHASGYSLTGTTGEPFFTGANAGSIQVNPKLSDDPALLQAGGAAGATGDNRVALALAQLKDQKLAALDGQTFGESYGQSVAQLGLSLSAATTQLDTQNVVEDMLRRQRDSVSGVSLDEEMTDIMKYQKAYQASARLITTVAEMLDTLLSIKP